MNLSALLPTDTRTIELASAFSLVLTSITLLLGAPASAWMLEIHAREFWVIVLSAFGVLQLIGVVHNTYSAEVVRVIVTWVVGAFWVWISFEYMIEVVRPTEVSAFLLGVSNLYAFVINLNLLVRGKWK